MRLRPRAADDRHLARVVIRAADDDVIPFRKRRSRWSLFLVLIKFGMSASRSKAEARLDAPGCGLGTWLADLRFTECADIILTYATVKHWFLMKRE
ncbi:hypothetical protein ABIE91_001716 [Bradyrhizobium elkanii]